MNIRYIIITLLVAVMMETNAQTVSTDSIEKNDIELAKSNKESFLKHMDNKLATSYYNSKYDTNYVARPHQRWLLRLLANQTGNDIYAKGTVKDVWSKYDLHTKYNTTISLEVNYCDYAVSLSINPAQIAGNYHDTEFNFEYHGQKLSCDFNYQRSTSLTGDIKLGEIDHLNEDGLCMNIINVAGYYTFNHRRFSFPAALCQNYLQRRSAGSWLAGASVQAGSIKTTDELKERSPQAPDVHLAFTNVALGIGYGYNFVFGKHSQWLLHFSMLPSVVVYKHNSLTVNNDKKKDHGLCLNMIFNERAALVYHFSSRYNVGASLMMSSSIYNNDNITLNQNKWLAHAFLGLRL